MSRGPTWSGERLKPLLSEGGRRGGRWNDRRGTIDGVMYRARTGLPWRDLPERFGSWITVCKRHRRWSADGTWQMLLTAIQAGQDAEGRVDWDVSRTPPRCGRTSAPPVRPAHRRYAPQKV
ncbi:transposase [Nonomuraea sp. NBC_01738]|uniref:transposase n=1 Tax=Nonomuraea sp. NBC_01738 TaxID=2976003 RepID=UPI003FA3D504